MKRTTAGTSFPGTATSVAQARKWLRTQCDSAEVPPDMATDAVQVLSELATNALVHSKSGGGNGTYIVHLVIEGNRLRLDVIDQGGPSQPTKHRELRSDPLAEHRVGLALVDHYAHDWWVRGGQDGRRVGAEIARACESIRSAARSGLCDPDGECSPGFPDSSCSPRT